MRGNDLKRTVMMALRSRSRLNTLQLIRCNGIVVDDAQRKSFRNKTGHFPIGKMLFSCKGE